ncbi:MAG: response regulator transcription factor [Clostridia bacterium]|nr:response regulator transcription factor [Clostridia bacterium]
MYRVFIIEDDRDICQSVEKKLAVWDIECKGVENFRSVTAEFAAFDPHMVLIDITLPFFNGYHWCEEIRKISSVPIIFISSAAESMNVVMAMNMGADDFISKPFDMNVLVAKIQALLRRTYDFSSRVPLLEHRGAVLNMGDGSLSYNGEKTELTKNEFRILLTLLENKGKTVSREKLMDALWQSDSFVDENTLNVNVNRLRKKLDALGLDSFIATKFGTGYIIQ